MASVQCPAQMTTSSTNTSQSSFPRRYASLFCHCRQEIAKTAGLLGVQINTSRYLSERGGPERLQWMTQVPVFSTAHNLDSITRATRQLCSWSPSVKHGTIMSMSQQHLISAVMCMAIKHSCIPCLLRHCFMADTTVRQYNLVAAVMAGVSLSGLSHWHESALPKSRRS